MKSHRKHERKDRGDSRRRQKSVKKPQPNYNWYDSEDDFADVDDDDDCSDTGHTTSETDSELLCEDCKKDLDVNSSSESDVCSQRRYKPGHHKKRKKKVPDAMYSCVVPRDKGKNNFFEPVDSYDGDYNKKHRNCSKYREDYEHTRKKPLRIIDSEASLMDILNSTDHLTHSLIPLDNKRLGKVSSDQQDEYMEILHALETYNAKKRHAFMKKPRPSLDRHSRQSSSRFSRDTNMTRCSCTRYMPQDKSRERVPQDKSGGMVPQDKSGERVPHNEIRKRVSQNESRERASSSKKGSKSYIRGRKKPPSKMIKSCSVQTSIIMSPRPANIRSKSVQTSRHHSSGHRHNAVWNLTTSQQNLSVNTQKRSPSAPASSYRKENKNGERDNVPNSKNLYGTYTGYFDPNPEEMMRENSRPKTQQRRTFSSDDRIASMFEKKFQLKFRKLIKRAETESCS